MVAAGGDEVSDEPHPGLLGEGCYLPQITLAAAVELLLYGASDRGTAAWIGDVPKLAPWRKILKAAKVKANG